MAGAWCRPPITLHITALLLGVLASGCTSTIRVTDTPQSGTQQLLLSSAFDSAIAAIDFHPLAGLLVFLDTSNLDASQSGYLKYRIREQMSLQGVRLAETRANADVIMEAGLGAYGTDSEKFALGLTQGLRIPEVSLSSHDAQYGVARLSMFAYLRETGVLIWQSGPFRADSYHRQRQVLGLGPFRGGTIEHPADRTREFPLRRKR